MQNNQQSCHEINPDDLCPEREWIPEAVTCLVIIIFNSSRSTSRIEKIFQTYCKKRSN